MGWVRVSGDLSERVATKVGNDGAFENVSVYIRDVIRRDKERVERETFERLPFPPTFTCRLCLGQCHPCPVLGEPSERTLIVSGGAGLLRTIRRLMVGAVKGRRGRKLQAMPSTR